ncbi:unnamed protein product [Mytilus coruscus]|uniref:Uncharacterized protein n=1 Tax=Mytilus coruscus TaxID=42192 RepID=A0A6J8E1J7_MYTCO|nr:unnamed protein product [Mytilus coruscus]
MMHDVQVEVEPDSGADVNVMDEYQYRAYKNRTRDGTELLESKTKLSTLQTSLKVKGEFIRTVRNATRGIKTKIIMIKGKTNSPQLIGKKTLIELGMLQIKEDGTLKEPNELGIQDGNKRRYREHSFKISDRVIFKQEKRNKWSTAYELEPYIIYEISGSSIGAQRKSDERKVFRDSSHFKLANNIDIPNSNDKWRDRILMHTKQNGDKHMVAQRRREMPIRTRRAPARFRDYVV